MSETIHTRIDASLDAAQDITLSEMHIRPIQGLLSGEVFSPHLTAHQSGDLAGFRKYDPFTDIGIRINERISARVGEPMVRENDKVLLSNLWVISDMTGERFLQNPGLMSEFEAALQLGACGIFAAQQEQTPVGYMLTNGYEVTGKDPNGETLSGFFNQAIELAHDAAKSAEARFVAANQKQKFSFHKQKEESPIIPKPTISLDKLLETAANYPLVQNSLVLVISDFRDTISLKGDTPNWLAPLSALGSLHGGTNNTAIAVEVVNPEDFTLSATTDTVVDPVSGKTLATSSLSAENTRYTTAMTRWTEAMRDAIGREGIGHIAVSVSDPTMLQSFAEQMQSLSGR